MRALGCALLVCTLAVCGRARNDAPTDALTAHASHPSAARYIGYEYVGVPPHHTLPDGVLNSGGALIGNPSDRPMFAIDQMSRDGVSMLWLVHSIGFTDRSPRWHVDDVLDVPTLPKGESIIWDASCAIHRAGDPEVIAIVVETNAEQYTRIVRAWRANRSAHAFQPIDTAGVSCANTGYDADD